MPVRSLNSSVLVWPDAAAVRRALTQWASDVASLRPDVERVGYIGSYARGDNGVGSDLDVVLVLARCDTPFEQRALDWNLTGLPVPVDVLVYTCAEWQALLAQASAFSRVVREEARWVYTRPDASR
jgi:uncharacterized protein